MENQTQILLKIEISQKKIQLSRIYSYISELLYLYELEKEEKLLEIFGKVKEKWQKEMLVKFVTNKKRKDFLTDNSIY